MKVYERTENGVTAQISKSEGMAEINHAQMAGQRDVRTMSSISWTDFAIEYKDGRSVRLILVEAPEPEGGLEEGPTAWTGEATRIVTVKGKRYAVGQIHPARSWTVGATSGVTPAHVDYWSERNGKAVGATRSTNGDAKPGTVGRAIWDAVTS
jgi:hypothetical protein